MLKEIWKDVVGFEGLYKISNYGNVKSLCREILVKGVHNCLRKQKYKEKILKRGLSKKKGTKYNYFMYRLSKNGKLYSLKEHRLVAEAFLKNENNYKCIDHIDGNPKNNFYKNLRWCSQKQNMQNEETIKRRKKSFRKKRKYFINGEYAVEVAKRNGISRRLFLQRICCGHSILYSATKKPRKRLNKNVNSFVWGTL